MRQTAQAELLSQLQHRAAVRDAALVHDTVLNHLAVVATSETGALHDSLRTAITADLLTLAPPTPHQSDEDDAHRTDAPAPSALQTAIRDASDWGLRLTTTGDLAAIGLLNDTQATATRLAIRQCLQNVADHAEVRDVEIAVLQSPGELMVMIVDGGRGFTVGEVPADRLGLRNSVQARITEVGGSVDIWSSPANGTSVVLRLPIGTGVTR
jgi:hypothetical protein